jgi:hypothetical protein
MIATSTAPVRATPAVLAQDAVQADFAAALLDPAGSVPAGLRAWNGSDPAARFAVYRNNVIVSLVAALSDTFAVVRRLVGADFFGAMAREFVRCHPPRSPVLAEYGEGFADFVAAFDPAAALPYLADMARLELARVCAFHAAEAEPVDLGRLAEALARPEWLAGTRLRLHPSLVVIRASHAVASLWAAHQRDEADLPAAVVAVDLDRPECAIVLRDGDAVLVQPVSAAVASFVDALQRAQPLGEACLAAGPDEPHDGVSHPAPFDLAATLALLIRHGALVGWHHEGEAA